MKKIIALCLAALMTMLCAVSFAENTVSTQIETGTDKFDVSFQLPEGARVLEGADWQEGNLYMANIMLKEGEYLYLSVDASGTENEAGLVTYNEASGYTDDAVLALTDVFADESVIVDRQVLTTAYGTKIAVVRFEDSAYAWTKWNGFEIGATLTNVDAEGNYGPITDEQLKNMTDFLSEFWMKVKISDPEATGTDHSDDADAELLAMVEWLTKDLTEADAAAMLNWDADTIREKLADYDGELKNHTVEEAAQEIHAKLSVMQEFLSALEGLSEIDLASADTPAE